MAVIVLAAGGYVIVRRAVGEPVNVRDLAIPPVVLLALGVRELAAGTALSMTQCVVTVALGVLAVLLGGARAATVRLYLREDTLWYRYRPLTYAMWLITAFVGMAARTGADAVADLPAAALSLYLSVGLTLAGENLVLATRGLRSGQPFAAEGRDSEATRQLIHGEMKTLYRRR